MGFFFYYRNRIVVKKGLTDSQELVIKQTLDNCFRIYHSQQITNEAINVRRKFGLKLPDSIIAATSIVTGLPLITADKGFDKVTSLDLILINL
jgi:predicted nucleic acid-binding protein